MLLTLATQQPRALLTIVQHTPSWVWMVLATLIWLGGSQFFARSVGLRRVLLMPIAMAVFSVWGIGSTFGAVPQVAGVLLAWLAAACAVTALSLWLLRSSPLRARYEATDQRFHLPGSAWPMLLIVGIFLVKWAVGVELFLQPALSHDSPFALQIALIYGTFTGVFAARTVRLRHLARTGNRSSTIVTA